MSISESSFPQDQIEKNQSSSKNLGASKKCNCRHSKCIKLYCECYQAKVLCDSSCHCTQCYNYQTNESRLMAMQNTLEKNPQAFQPKIQQDQKVDPLELGKHSKGCACRKSGCMKKYCECFQAKVPCSIQCKCSECKNFGFLTRDHFLKSTGQMEDMTKQNCLYQLLLAKDNNHLQSLLNESQLLNTQAKQMFQQKEIGNLSSQMIQIAQMDNEQLKILRNKKSHLEKIKIEKEQKENDLLNEEEGSVSEQELLVEEQDLLCKDEVSFDENKMKPIASSGEKQSDEQQNQQINNLKKELILELFLTFLKQSNF